MSLENMGADRKLEDAPIARYFIKFSGIGLVGTIAHYGVLLGLVHSVGTGPVLGSCIGAIVGALINYILNRYWNYSSGKPHLETGTKFFMVSAIGFTLNGAILTLLVHSLGIYYLIAQLVTSGLVLVWNFVMNHYWTFG